MTLTLHILNKLLDLHLQRAIMYKFSMISKSMVMAVTTGGVENGSQHQVCSLTINSFDNLLLNVVYHIQVQLFRLYTNCSVRTIRIVELFEREAQDFATRDKVKHIKLLNLCHLRLAKYHIENVQNFLDVFLAFVVEISFWL